MAKDVDKTLGINKDPEHIPDEIKISITPSERDSLMDMAVIMSKLRVKETNSTLIPNNTLSSLGKMALSFMTNIYCAKVFTQSEIASNLPDKQALNEFIAFRKKYMDFPVDKQIAELKRVGIVK